MNSLRFAIRQLLNYPGFTTVAVFTLALGIGATTAIVSVVRAAVIDPLPVQHPERLMQVGYMDKERGWTRGINRSALREVRQQTNLFVRVTAYNGDLLTWQGEEFPRRMLGVRVTSEFLSLWQQRALLACWLPARRAAQMNPITALRHE